MSLGSSIGFLDLPAEIRNQIYEYLIEDVDTNVGHKTIRLRPRAEFSKHWRKKNPHRGEVYALNQVCRTTRHEFGRLYVSQIAHRVRADEQLLPRFLHDFFLGEHISNSFALQPRKIQVELQYPLGGKPPRLNVQPLLALCLGNEDVDCSFLNKFDFLPELDNLFWNHTVEWGEAILNDLQAIRVYTPSGTTTVVDLVFRADSELHFIQDIKRSRSRPPASMQGYLRALGCLAWNTWDSRDGVWNVVGRVEFAASKAAPRSAKEEGQGRSEVFETQYRLIES